MVSLQAKFDKEREAWPTCAIENANMRLASICGMRVSRTRIIRLTGGREVLLVERFDRTGDARVPFVSAMTMLGKYGESPHGTYAGIAGVVRKFSPSSTIREDLRELYMRMTFNALCNNSDDHLRNHGFLHAGNGQWRLSPAYDVVPQPVDEGAARMLHLAAGKSGRAATVENLLSSCHAYGLESGEAEKIVSEMRATIYHEWENVFAEQGVPRRHFDELHKCFSLSDISASVPMAEESRLCP
jgi:serine/threonine-protein kinase HipA